MQTQASTKPHKIIRGDNDSKGLNAKLLHSFILLRPAGLPFNCKGQRSEGAKLSDADLQAGWILI